MLGEAERDVVLTTFMAAMLSREPQKRRLRIMARCDELMDVREQISNVIILRTHLEEPASPAQISAARAWLTRNRPLILRLSDQ